MTREEIYASIYTHEEIYRPPQEENCACLEVALGCSWGKCLFCDFAKDRFQVHSMAKIEWNLPGCSGGWSRRRPDCSCWAKTLFA